MKKIKIAIIDSGVKFEHPAFPGKKPILVCNKERINPSDFYGHGTAIYNIIRKVENIAEITNFVLNDIENGIREEELIELLKK